jgi:hypothetical protein
MDLHVLTARGAVLVAQVVDGKVILPPVPAAPQPPGEPVQWCERITPENYTDNKKGR